MEAEIITIGTEILLGEIVDTNTRTLARELREIGLDIYRTSTVGDNSERIAEAVKESMQRASAVITTGGLGPTIDDATREGVAMAFEVEPEFIPELWDQIQERFNSFGRKPTENNRRQAYIPEGAIPIENPVGTAPAFIMESESSCVIALPGVPAEMIFLLENDAVPYLRKRLKLHGTIKSRILRTAGLGESVIDKRIEDLEQLSNPTVGLSAHPGRVDIRITAKAGSEIEADEMIWGVEATLHQRLGESIYGSDEATLESVIASWLREHKMKIFTLEYGTAGALGASFAPHSDVFASGQIINEAKDVEQSQNLLKDLCENNRADCGLALLLLKEENGHQLTMHLRLGLEAKSRSRHYAGKFVYAEDRAVSLGLERLRRMMLTHSQMKSDTVS
jgi:competence/damage-inducible protein CinA-like protein